ncbi:MAG TPA: phosphatidylserine decarboxylase family protein [Candidatus Alistipes pullicola]|nr:phosphatidylserine decarboxylase family protein [Candidatus Alistipes pullicola]
MRIHKEGTSIILCSALISAGITVAAFLLLPEPTAWIVAIVVWGFTLFITSFFRSPNRVMRTDAGAVFSPADGKIVALEEVDENEYFQGKRIVVSVFMSIWNVHVNWFPVAGRVDYFRHHHGLFLVAWHPKSSEDNERTTTVVDMGGEKIMFRQIAGLVARRIVSYARVGHHVEQNTQCGFIKFGSRVDIFLPLDADIRVKLGDKVVGTQTLIARLNQADKTVTSQ